MANFNDDNEQDMIEYTKTFLRAVKLRYGKLALYGLSYKDLGFAGVLAKINDKVKRVINITQHHLDGKDESVEDSLLDISNYAIMGIMILQEQSRLKAQQLGQPHAMKSLQDIMTEVLNEDAGKEERGFF
jgi:hypothetical protein